jgi:hypothetical protein
MIIGEQTGEDGLDAARGSVGEENVASLGGESVALLDEVDDVLSKAVKRVVRIEDAKF